MCFRAEITNPGEETVRNCKAHLTKIVYGKNGPEMGPTILTWADAVPYTTQVDLIKDVPRGLDLIGISEHNRVHVFSLSWPINQLDFFEWAGIYSLTVVVSADNSVPIRKEIELNFTGDFKTSTMRSLN
jgi:hypothetical protein